MNIQALDMQFIKERDQLLIAKGRFDNLMVRRKKIQDELGDNEQKTIDYEQAKLLLSQSSIAAKRKAKPLYEEIITSGLQYIIEEDISFEVDMEEDKNNKTEAEFYVVSSETGEPIRTSPEDANSGGGISDLVGVIGQTAILEGQKDPHLESALVLDEPFKMLSPSYIPKTGEFLKEYQQTFERQIIMSTHNPYLQEIADRKIHVTKVKGISQVEVEDIN